MFPPSDGGGGGGVHNHISLTSVAQTRLSPPSSRHQSLHVSFCTVRINRINKKNHNNQTHEYVVSKLPHPGSTRSFFRVFQMTSAAQNTTTHSSHMIKMVNRQSDVQYVTQTALAHFLWRLLLSWKWHSGWQTADPSLDWRGYCNTTTTKSTKRGSVSILKSNNYICVSILISAVAGLLFLDL